MSSVMRMQRSRLRKRPRRKPMSTKLLQRIFFLSAMAIGVNFMMYPRLTHPEEANAGYQLIAKEGSKFAQLSRSFLKESKRKRASEKDLIVKETDDDGCGFHGYRLVDQCVCDPGWGEAKCSKEDPGHSQHDLRCLKNPTNDICMNIPRYGRVRVLSAQRMEDAQRCEQEFWAVNGGTPERSHDQIHAFDRFNALPMNLGRVLEVGAGPFTKTRMILESPAPAGKGERTLEHVTLVDPLIKQYLSDKEVITSYPNKELCSNGKCYNTLLLSNPGEDNTGLPTKKYDTAILVNTLEHCENAIRVLDNVYQALKPGGTLVLGDAFATDWQLRANDRCHPLQPTRQLFDDYLAKFSGEPLLSPRTGNEVRGVSRSAAMARSLFAIVRKGSS